MRNCWGVNVKAEAERKTPSFALLPSVVVGVVVGGAGQTDFDG